MLRLLKLAVLAGIVYVIYEIFTALTHSEANMGTVREAFTPSPSPAPAPVSSPGPVLSGATHEGALTKVRTADGGEHRQVVGRGVIRR